MNDYLAANRANWDDRAAAHATSPDYELQRFVEDPAHLSGVVRFDRRRLGDIAGLRAVHLQCHIGTDTVSLARLGARMTGLDFSSVSLQRARALAAATGTDVRFVESDVYGAVDALAGETFELVYTGIGALCWLPSITRWAAVVAELLEPGGRLFMREGHPMLWALDDEPHGEPRLAYSYFERPEPLVFDSPKTYVQTDTPIEHGLTYEWNHGLGEIVTALLDEGLTLTGLTEHDSVPWEALPGHMERDHTGEWRLRDRPERLAASYTLMATKPRRGAVRRGRGSAPAR
ncbi:MAG TPA: class I SAM-dependent methyltransferase [Solirubrobacteraceae bacterium]|nr:class I SAM-dependent methyltransferase [Solirubrobacteraceae bacterium]